MPLTAACVYTSLILTLRSVRSFSGTGIQNQPPLPSKSSEPWALQHPFGTRMTLPQEMDWFTLLQANPCVWGGGGEMTSGTDREFTASLGGRATGEGVPDSPLKEPNFKIVRVSGMPVGDEDLLADLLRVASATGKATVGQKEYRLLGKHDDSTLTNRFGSWNNALRTAGLDIGNEVNIRDEQLFENLLTLWQHYGRQPRRVELSAPPSRISQSPYNRRFGCWSAALESFVRYANAKDSEILSRDEDAEKTRRRTGRDPSLRLRWHVLQRDHFTCCACGRTPALTPGVELHVDHVAPWSKGGETVLENLQTLCSICNLGKSNVSEDF